MSRRTFDNRNTASVLVENLERRQLMAAAPQITGIKIAKAQDVDGSAANSNRITISFNKAVRLVDVSKFSSFGYANDLSDVTGVSQIKARVGLTITKYIEGGKVFDNVLQIITDRLVRKGSRLVIQSGGLTDTKNNALVYDATTPAKTITFTVGQNKPRYTLANRNFSPTDLSIVDRDVFASAPVATTASTTPSAVTIRNNLVSFLGKKLNPSSGSLATKITQAQYNAALATYDSAATAAIIPNANLRAALASLVGTAAEPAINSYLTKANATGKAYTSIDFGSVSSGTPVGETRLSTPGGRLSLTINNTFAGEPFQVLSATLGHEIMHQDATAGGGGNIPNSQDEEIVANAVETIIWAQQLLVDPSVAANGTKLVVRTNTRLLALLNSGDRLFPYGGIFAAPALKFNGNVFPGGKNNPGGFAGSVNVPSFENWIRREYISRGFSAGGTSTSAVGQTILKNIVGSKGNFTLFGNDVEKLLDTNNTLLTDAVYIRLAATLKLRITP